jgi:hypothetical protein
MSTGTTQNHLLAQGQRYNYSFGKFHAGITNGIVGKLKQVDYGGGSTREECNARRLDSYYRTFGTNYGHQLHIGGRDLGVVGDRQEPDVETGMSNNETVGVISGRNGENYTLWGTCKP